MHFPVEGTRKTLLFFTVLTSWTIAFGKPSGDKTLNLRIGFDLTQGKDGAPSLRIRDFEESGENERYPRAADNDDGSKEEEKAKPAIRADSFSDSKEDKRHEDSSKEDRQDSSNSDEGGYDSDVKNRHKSTKGLNPEEYEPEENAKVHGRYQEDEDGSDDEVRRYRRKRHVDYESEKRKSKKVRSGRKQGVTRAYRWI